MTQNTELEKKLRSLSIDRSDAGNDAGHAAADRPRGGMSFWLKLVLVLCVLAVGGAVFIERTSGGLTAWVSHFAQTAQAQKEPVRVAETSTETQPDAPVVDLAQTPRSAEPSVVGSGHVIALYELAVGARLSGKVQQIHVEASQRVSAGDILVQLDDTDAHLALDVARATEAAASAVVAQARASVAAASAPVERLKALVSRGAAGAAQLQDAQLELKHLEQTVEVARRQQELAALHTDQARNVVALHVIRAPFDAIVASIPAVPGQLIVEMGQSGPADTTLLTLIDTSTLFVDVDVAERNLSQVHVDMPAQVRLDAYPDRRLDAYVHSINPRASLEKGTVTVRLKLEPTDLSGVLTNMAAKVTFSQDRKIALSALD